MYRTVALNVLRQGGNLNSHEEIARVAETTDIAVRFVDGIQRIFLDAEDVTERIRMPDVTQAVSPVCEVTDVRTWLVALQRELGRSGGVVIEGRDIGTVVFPDADLKVYLTASKEVRGRRRLEDLQRSGVEAELQTVIEDIERRDQRDQSRGNSPLKMAPDAVLIDTSEMTFEEQVEAVIGYVSN
jgi:cytidylate kinase